MYNDFDPFQLEFINTKQYKHFLNPTKNIDFGPFFCLFDSYVYFDDTIKKQMP